MSDGNGAAPPGMAVKPDATAPTTAPALVRTVISVSQGITRIVYTRPNGMFAGAIEVMTADPVSFRQMGLDFARFTAEATSSLVRAAEMPAAAAPPTRQ